jgi:hypothetical protein
LGWFNGLCCQFLCLLIYGIGNGYTQCLSCFAVSLQIKVRLPNDEVVHGWLHYYSSPYSLAVIITHSLPLSLDLCVACLGNDMHVESSAELLAVRRCFDSGELVSTRGSVIHGTWTGGIHKKQRKLSTCKIIEVRGWYLVWFFYMVKVNNCTVNSWY